MLAVIALARDPRGVATAARHLAPLVAVGIGLFILALKDRIRLGSVTLVTIGFPPSIRAIIGILHANGRFVWLLMYLIPVVAVAALARNVKARSLLLILASAVVLQAAEVIPLVSGLRTLHEKQSVEYDAASSIHFSAAVKNFIVLPPWQCGGTLGPLVPGHGVSAATFQGFVSLSNNIRSNSEYLARTPVKTIRPWCEADIIDRIGALRQDSVYYFSLALYKQLTPSHRTGHWCDVLYDGVLCRPDVATLGESEAARAARAL